MTNKKLLTEIQIPIFMITITTEFPTLSTWTLIMMESTTVTIGKIRMVMV